MISYNIGQVSCTSTGFCSAHFLEVQSCNCNGTFPKVEGWEKQMFCHISIYFSAWKICFKYINVSLSENSWVLSRVCVQLVLYSSVSFFIWTREYVIYEVMIDKLHKHVVLSTWSIRPITNFLTHTSSLKLFLFYHFWICFGYCFSSSYLSCC